MNSVVPAPATANAALSNRELQDALFSMMKGFEDLAACVYLRDAPTLNVPQKQQLVAQLAARVKDDRALQSTPLASPVARLLAQVAQQSHGALLVQGLVLEQLGRVIYERITQSDAADADSKTLASMGVASATAVLEQVPALIAARIGTGDTLFAAFVDASTAVLSQLDQLGEGVDAVFGERFGISFADLMGDLTSELLPMCTGLGIERRKLVIHLTGALMHL